MFDKLFELFKEETRTASMRNILHYIDELLDELDDEYIKDGNLRDAAIECIIEILQKTKSKKTS